MQIPHAVMMEAARNGSPALLSSLGRLFGFGSDEQKALMRGDFPVWTFALVGVVGGVAAGIYLQRKFPQQVSKVLGV